MATSVNSTVIEVKERSLEGSDRVLCVGTRARLQDVFDVPDCPDLLRSSLSGSVSWQQRGEITVQQAVLSPNLVPSWISALLAYGARLSFSDPLTEDSLLASFLRRSDPRPGGLTAVLVPLDVPGRFWGSAQMGRTPADHPIVTASAVVDVTEDRVRQARVALSGVWHEHARLIDSAELLIGVPFCEETIHRVAASVRREVRPVGDFLGSADYRRAVAGVLARRALEACLDRFAEK